MSTSTRSSPSKPDTPLTGVTSITYFQGEKGDEIAWYTANYNTKKSAAAYIASALKSYSVMVYGTHARYRRLVTTDDAMTESYSLKKDFYNVGEEFNTRPDLRRSHVKRRYLGHLLPGREGR